MKIVLSTLHRGREEQSKERMKLSNTCDQGCRCINGYRHIFMLGSTLALFVKYVDRTPGSACFGIVLCYFP